jgi:hypothetical protein
MFALFSGLLGTAFSVLIRMELSGPGVQYIADNQLYNSIITAHALLMIFFMVKKINIFSFGTCDSEFYMLEITCVNSNPVHSSVEVAEILKYSTHEDEDGFLIKKPVSSQSAPIDVFVFGYENNKVESTPLKSVKVTVKDPFNNRKIIANIAKNQKGIYVWETLDGKHMYVGHSINLYNRISSYFMPSILKTKARRVLRHFNKHGFNDILLTIYIMDENSTLEQVVELEQYFIDTLKPNLNVDLVASSSGYHTPMSQEIKDKLRKERGTPVYVYSEDFTLLYIFESKQQMYNIIKIHHTSLNDCLSLGLLYLDEFLFSLDLIEESDKTDLLSLNEIEYLIKNKRSTYSIKHPSAKAILAEYKDDPEKNKEFTSLNSLANDLKGDRKVIRDYLKGIKTGYYRGK